MYRLQLRCYLGLVHEQQHLPALKQLLKLYTSISLAKLASLLDLDEAALRSQLMLLKACSMHRTVAANQRPAGCNTMPSIQSLCMSMAASLLPYRCDSSTYVSAWISLQAPKHGAWPLATACIA